MDYFQRKISLYRGNPYRSRLEEALKRVLFRIKGVPAPPGVLKRWVIFPSERDMSSAPCSSMTAEYPPFFSVTCILSPPCHTPFVAENPLRPSAVRILMAYSQLLSLLVFLKV